MIDVTTAGDDGHWDHADIKRLCEYRDQLKAALRRILDAQGLDVNAAHFRQIALTAMTPQETAKWIDAAPTYFSEGDDGSICKHCARHVRNHVKRSGMCFPAHKAEVAK